MKRRKVIYALCLFGVFLLNVFYVNYEFYAMFWLIVLIPVLSLLIFMIAKNNLALYFRMLGRNVVQGQKIRIEVKTDNHVPVLLAESRIYFEIEYSNASVKEYKKLRMNTFFDNYKASVAFNTVHSGIITVRSDKVVMYDYLMFFKKEKHFKGELQIAVFPELLPLGDKNHYDRCDGIEFGDEQWLVLKGDGDEVIDFREYQNGDSINRIHWKLSVKMDEMIVKKFGDIDDHCIRILVDLTLSNNMNFRDYLDRIYQMAYSIGYYYVRNEIQASFIIWKSKEQKLTEYTFCTHEELEYAVVMLMRQKCSENAAGNMKAAFEGSRLKLSEKPYWITADNYESRDYQVVNVAEDDLDKIIETLYERQKILHAE